MTTTQQLADDIRFGLNVDVWAQERVGFVPDDWQRRVLCSTAPQIALNVCRQGGKSSICALKASHVAIYRSGSLTLLISRGQRQSAEIFQKVSATLRHLGVKLRTDNQTSCELMNGSRIISLPGDAAGIRGYSPDLVIFDEASFVPDDVYNAVRPMLSVTRGQLFLISTPNGRQGFFFEEWSSGGPAWYREQISAHECPRIAPAFLEAEKRRRGLWFKQEYECSFEDGSSQLFSYDLIQSMFSEPFPVLEWKIIT
jgi:Terminase large subunit, T4likevirus-type, N-terminal